MRLTVVCPSGHSIQATSDVTERQIRCPKCQSLVTVPASDASLDLRTDARVDVGPTVKAPYVPAATLASGETQPRPPALAHNLQRTKARNRRVGLAVCAVALVGIAGFAVLVLRNSRNPQSIKSSSPAAERPAEAPKPTRRDQSVASEAEEPYPRIPGAMHHLPDWLVRECPFDANAFSPQIPRNENAAPLYLEAIAEFSAELSRCFPPDQREQIRQRGLDRANRLNAFRERWSSDIARFVKERSVSDNAQLDQLLSEYQSGLDKLALAQKRSRCLFESGLDIASLLPHAQGARQVVRVLELRAIRDLDRDDVAAATGAVEAGLRLSRDLRPRGFVITQLVTVALNSIGLRSIVPAILRARACSLKECDRLLALLEVHRRQALDPWTTALQTEYVTLRRVVSDVQHRTGDFTPERISAITRDFGGAIPGNSPGHLLRFFFDASTGKPSNEKEIDAINTRLELMSEQEWAREARAAADWYLAFEPIGRMHRAQQQDAIAQARSRFKDMFFLSQWQSAAEPVLEACRRDETVVRGTVCLCALKRWQLAHPEPPRDLASILAEAGVREAPIDPYSGEPFRLSVVGGKPVIYSIGADGVDDHGEFDNLDGRNESGDVLFQL